MQLRNIFFVMLILSLISCQSKKAAGLKITLEEKGRAVFNIMVGKNGHNERKLKCLINGDFHCAQQAINEEEQAFNKIIKEINALQTDHIKHGDELKAATINYYEAVKALEISDRLDIAQQQISQDKANTREVRDAAIQKHSQLLKSSVELHKVIRKKEQLLAEAQKQYNLNNHLD